MAIHLQRPTDVRIGAARPHRRPVAHRALTTTALDVTVRGLLAGTGIGILLAAHAGFASIAVLGVLAFGAALLSWDP